MKKTFTVILTVALMAVLGFGQAIKITIPDNPFAKGPALIDQNGHFRGNLNSNTFDPDSVSNPFGNYGSKWSPDSLLNPYNNLFTYPPTTIEVHIEGASDELKLVQRPAAPIALIDTFTRVPNALDATIRADRQTKLFNQETQKNKNILAMQALTLAQQTEKAKAVSPIDNMTREEIFQYGVSQGWWTAPTDSPAKTPRAHINWAEIFQPSEKTVNVSESDLP